MIENYGKGAVKKTPDTRDFPMSVAMGAARISDTEWTKGFKLPEPPDTDQGSSDACVSYATSYYHWQKKGKVYSKRDLFSRIALGYGAYIVDGVKAISKIGQLTIGECQDPLNPDTKNMRDRNGIDAKLGYDDVTGGYFNAEGVGMMDSLAWAIKTQGGAVFGVTGDNTGWKNGELPKPPSTGITWSHALYVYGFGIRDGKKYILAKSSWCNWVKNHHITEDYFKAPNAVFNGYCIIDRKPPIEQIYKRGNELGLISRAEDPARMVEYLTKAKIDYKLLSDGTLDFNSFKPQILL